MIDKQLNYKYLDNKIIDIIKDENPKRLYNMYDYGGELVYNDILNRDESVKKPILLQIFKDKEHPCWAATAWILDVTGEIQKK